MGVDEAGQHEAVLVADDVGVGVRGRSSAQGPTATIVSSSISDGTVAEVAGRAHRQHVAGADQRRTPARRE